MIASTFGPIAGVLLVAFGYTTGSLPWGYWFGRWFHGIDVRASGSGGTGATNVARTMGWQTSVIVLLLDLLKGALPVLAGRWIGIGDWWIALAAVAAVVGHCWSPWIHFTGGKGVATAAGGAIAMFLPVLLVLPVMVAIVAMTRYVSLASILGCLLATAGVAVLAASGRAEWSWACGIAAMTAIILFKHQGNMKRLLTGSERRLGDRVSGSA